MSPFCPKSKVGKRICESNLRNVTTLLNRSTNKFIQEQISHYYFNFYFIKKKNTNLPSPSHINGPTLNLPSLSSNGVPVSPNRICLMGKNSFSLISPLSESQLSKPKTNV